MNLIKCIKSNRINSVHLPSVSGAGGAYFGNLATIRTVKPIGVAYIA